jgi:hypothetical protein
MLVAEFFLGMILNLWGTADSTAPSWQRYLYFSVLPVHIFLGLGIGLGAVMLSKIACRENRDHLRLTLWGATAVLAAFAAGVLNITAPWSDAWSFAMATAFIAALVIYANLWASSA